MAQVHQPTPAAQQQPEARHQHRATAKAEQVALLQAAIAATWARKRQHAAALARSSVGDAHADRCCNRGSRGCIRTTSTRGVAAADAAVPRAAGAGAPGCRPGVEQETRRAKTQAAATCGVQKDRRLRLLLLPPLLMLQTATMVDDDDDGAPGDNSVAHAAQQRGRSTHRVLLGVHSWL
jgi:hypothetical protein